jgi:hypothetical protein
MVTLKESGLEQRLLEILQQESGTEITDRSVTIGSLFEKPRSLSERFLQKIGLGRVNAELATVIVRTEIVVGHSFCDPCRAIEQIKAMTVEKFLWCIWKLFEDGQGVP